MGIEYDWQGDKTDSRSPAYDHTWEYADDQLRELAIAELCNGSAVKDLYDELGEKVADFTNGRENLQELILMIMGKDSVEAFPKAQEMIESLISITKQHILRKER